MYCGGDRPAKDEIIRSFKEALKDPSVRYVVVEKYCFIAGMREFKNPPPKIIKKELGEDWLKNQGFVLTQRFKDERFKIFDVYEREEN